MSSELQEVIAKASVAAFNSGVEAGRREERARTYRILENLGMTDEVYGVGEFAFVSDIKEYIEDKEIK